MIARRARRPTHCKDAVVRRRTAARQKGGSGRATALQKPRWTPDQERLFIRMMGLGGVVLLALLVSGCNGSNQPNTQVNQFPQTPVGGPAQPCPNSDVVQVEILDDQINLPVKNRTVIVHYSDGTTLPVVTDQSGIASVCVRPGQTFTIEVPDVHTLASETHVPR